MSTPTGMPYIYRPLYMQPLKRNKLRILGYSTWTKSPNKSGSSLIVFYLLHLKSSKMKTLAYKRCWNDVKPFTKDLQYTSSFFPCQHWSLPDLDSKRLQYKENLDLSCILSELHVQANKIGKLLVTKGKEPKYPHFLTSKIQDTRL